jgi:hypothetical protein
MSDERQDEVVASVAIVNDCESESVRGPGNAPLLTAVSRRGQFSQVGLSIHRITKSVRP